mmetsp:Transcript_97424/g.218380  ORF Transcript_97424/g.218380 Transcript_97424/m.218380 type:complete len:213 (+) Transcript_97424:84-722(+)
MPSRQACIRPNCEAPRATSALEVGDPLERESLLQVLLRIISVLATVNQLLQGSGCRVAALARVQVDTIAVQQGVTGHVEHVHEVQGHKAAEQHGDQHGSQRTIQRGDGLNIREGSMGSSDVCQSPAGKRNECSPKDCEDVCGTIQDGHRTTQLDDHLYSLPGSIAKVVRGYGHVNVGILVDELDGVLAAVDATCANTEETLDDLAVGGFLVL